MMVKKKSLYSGILNEPMDFHMARASLLGIEPTEDIKAEYLAENLKQFFERVSALFKHYEIDIGDDGSAMSLALALAQDHVPAFKFKDRQKRGRGRPGKWTGFKSLELYADVKYLTRSGQPDLNACRILAETEKYQGRYGGETKENIHRRYLEGFKKIDPALQKVVATLIKSDGERAFEKTCISVFALRKK